MRPCRKAVILAGGQGTRLAEETSVRPKPMIEIGGRPILWHIMKIYAAHDIKDFIVCLGYKGYVIKEYFANYFLHLSDVTFDLAKNSMSVHHNFAEPWTVTLIDTGDDTMTGGRLKRAQSYIGDEDFCMTYGDGVSDVNIGRLIKHHQSHGRFATVTATIPTARFGALDIEGDFARGFKEKPSDENAWINGGFFVLSPSVFDYIAGDASVWERGPLERLANEGQLAVYRHDGFWHAMDTLRDKIHLENLWASGTPPWKVW